MNIGVISTQEWNFKHYKFQIISKIASLSVSITAVFLQLVSLRKTKQKIKRLNDWWEIFYFSWIVADIQDFFAFEESLSRDKKNTRHFYNFNLIMHFYQEQHRFSTKIKGTPRENVWER